MTRVAITHEIVLETETCCNKDCGMVFAMPATFRKQALDNRGQNGVTFCCPRGHRQWYTGENETEKLRRERDRLKQDQAWYEQRLKAERERAEHERRRANGYKGHATKITKRAKAGVCPCCNRSFENLRRHMETKHPTFTPMDLETAPAANGVAA